MELLHHAIEDPRGFGHFHVDIDSSSLSMIAHFANGDARVALNTLEMAFYNAPHEHYTNQCVTVMSMLLFTG